ncbi:FtsK/SpoIIIE family DNA translocase [Pandoraea anhela]|uniref:DNA translocase FtsK n=1 Tax=Pandoraea anhela TaxID=2508295 RepID=A0A5E4VIH2_9BURK|nr:DNA translocase FtsK [Pandoraea anhela]VVE11264.1 DNA translocase FtsK [Pandoraea anhela]
MGFGWFGLSTFWLLALCWPGVRGLLGGEIRIFGPGTLRMLLGVPLAMVSSATLAALTGGDGNTAGGSVGQSLSHGLHVALGGSLAMGVAGFVLIFSLPLVFGTTWWGMFSRGKSADDEDDTTSFEPRESRESRDVRADVGRREPVRGLSQMSFDIVDRSDRAARGGFTPTLGQGHHNVGSLTESPVPRRRGLAAQPRWKLSEEERARLDAMQPPPLTTRGAPRAEPSFGGAGLLRPAGKGTSLGRGGVAAAATLASAGAAGAAGSAAAGTRPVLPRGAYAAGTSRGDTLRMTEFVRAEPGLASREPRMTASPPSSGAAPMAARPAASVPATGATGASSASSALRTPGSPAPSPSADPLNSTSIPGATGYRRPVGMAPAHLRGTIVHSPFRKPQLGLEDIPPRGAPPVAPRAQALGAQPPLADTDTDTDADMDADGGAAASLVSRSPAPTVPTASPTTSSAGSAGSALPSPHVAAPRPATAPVMRGAASWSAADAARPLSADVSEFSPIDWSVNDVEPTSVEVEPEGPTPEMLAQQEAARAAEQARLDALAALRSEAEALLRDLREWSGADATANVGAPASEARSAASSLAAAATVDGDPANVVSTPRESAPVDACAEPTTLTPAAAPRAPTAPSASPTSSTSSAPLSPADVLNLPPTVLLPKAAVTVPATSMSSSSAPPRRFLFADVLASVEAYDMPVPPLPPLPPLPPVPPVQPVPPVPLASPEVGGIDLPVAGPVKAPDGVAAQSREPFDTMDASPPFDVSEASDIVDSAAALSPSVDDDIAPMSKPHYVLRADGTWARADGMPLAHDDPTPQPHDVAPKSASESASAVAQLPASPATSAIPAIPSFVAATPSPSFGMAASDAPQTANFSAHTPYELPPPRVAIDYDLPSLDLLSPATQQDHANVVSADALAAVSQLIEQRLAEFKVPVTVVGASAGPVITRFEVEPAVGVRGAQVVGLMKDLARALGVTSIRVVETIPGKTCMGLELPNAQRQMIRLSEILTAPVFDTHRSRLALAMGKDITGEPIVADLARAPHLLVAGTTGSGKSVAVNAMILSLLYKATPDDVRLIMIDPKMLELSVYGGIPHLLAPVVTDMKQAAHALNWCVGEMEKRYRLMSALGVRNLAGYNEKIDAARAAGEKVGNPFSLTPDAPEPLDRLPFIVVVIDELADLMMVAGKKIEELIARLAQKARAAGIHLILATQRPSVDVITGLIKANIPTRVAFQVSSKIDSRTILDQMGAESLLGQGDMLFLPPGTGYPQRVHGAFVADDEVHRVVEHWQQYGEPDYDDAILAGDPADAATTDLFGESAGDAEADPLYDEAAAFVLNSRRASISAVQRQLRIGYNRAARLIEQMEAAGLVTPMGRNGTREVVAPGE